MARPPVRIAVVGAGSVGRRHIEAIRNDRDCALFAVVDPAPGAQAHAHAIGAAWHGSLDDMFRAGGRTAC